MMLSMTCFLPASLQLQLCELNLFMAINDGNGCVAIHLLVQVNETVVAAAP